MGDLFFCRCRDRLFPLYETVLSSFKISPRTLADAHSHDHPPAKAGTLCNRRGCSYPTRVHRLPCEVRCPALPTTSPDRGATSPSESAKRVPAVRSVINRHHYWHVGRRKHVRLYFYSTGMFRRDIFVKVAHLFTFGCFGSNAGDVGVGGISAGDPRQLFACAHGGDGSGRMGVCRAPCCWTGGGDSGRLSGLIKDERERN